MHVQKTLLERVLQAVGFELLAIFICTPLLAWVMNKPLFDMGVATIAIAVLALLWNVLFNGMFDRVLKRLEIARNAWVRIVHALLFEGGLVAVAVPLVAWWLQISLWQAFLLDIGVLLFFLPYTYAYHWAYDAVRERMLVSRGLVDRSGSPRHG